MYPNNDFTDGNIFLVNELTLGKFQLHYGSVRDNPNKSALRSCFYCSAPIGNVIKLLPGYQTFNQKFYRCPLLACFVQINELEFIKDDISHFRVNVVLFSKDFARYKELDLKIISNYNAHSLGNLNDYINTLNRYIDYDNDIFLLNEAVFKERINFNFLKERALFDIVNKLLFKFYENCLYRVGKDNTFWNEIEITNLPDSEYFVKTLIICLKDSGTIDSIEYNDSKKQIFITYGREDAYSPSISRRLIEFDGRMELEIKDLIKYRLQGTFKPEMELNDRLKRQSDSR